MRQPKYYVKGTKGNIQVSKGTFLSIQKRNKSKKQTNKLLNFKSNSHLDKQKMINKKVILQPTYKKKNSIQKSNSHSTTFNPYRKNIQFQQKNCPDTIESEKMNEQRSMEFQVSQFSLSMQKDIPFVFQTEQNSLSVSLQKSLIQEKVGQNFENFWRTSHLVSINDETDNSEYYSQSDSQESTWSMINENVQAMTLSLSLSVYDHLYGKKD